MGGELNLQEKSLGQILQSMGLLRADQLKQALEEQKRTGEMLGRVLVRAGWVTERDVLHALKGLLVVTFLLEGQFFGLEAFCVLEIIRAGAVTPVPEAPDFVEGIINFRNRVVPLVDLRKRFGLPPAEGGDSRRIIVCELPERTAGLLVDAVGAVLRLRVEDLSPAPAGGEGIPRKFLYGLGRIGGDFCTILKLETLLESREPIRLRSRGAG